MKNISFDNPYLLLLIIPFALAIIIPYMISISTDNKTRGWKISLIIHLAISVVVCLAIAGMMSVTVLTKTTVYVVADVSYSSERNLDKIDEYINEIKESLPENSSLGVVCFGKTNSLITSAGRTLKSVKEAEVDDSGTNIAGALSYTGGLFPEGTIKRIILITDGNDNINRDLSSVASTIETLTDNDIKVDTIFLDNTLTAEDHEVQLSSVDFNSSTHLNQPTEAEFLVQASSDAAINFELYSRPRVSGVPDGEYELIKSTLTIVTPGFNVVSMELPADKQGVYEYKAVITSDQDKSEHNNMQEFIQSVAGKKSILLVTDQSSDAISLEHLYGSDATIDARIVSFDRVPYKVEDLATYDEIILSNLDIRKINNFNGVNTTRAFIDSVDTVVSKYGKGLITMGDLLMQSEDDPLFDMLEEILPVDYGNSNRKEKLYTILVDISHSMNTWSRFELMKELVRSQVSMLNDDDLVSIIIFYGVAEEEFPPSIVGNVKDEIFNYLDNELKPEHDTELGNGLSFAYSKLKSNTSKMDKQLIVISDGHSFDNQAATIQLAKDIRDLGVKIKAYDINENPEGCGIMKSIVEDWTDPTQYKNGRNANDLFGDDEEDWVEEVTESIIKVDSLVKIGRTNDPVVDEIKSLPSVSIYVQSSKKYDAIVPISVRYYRGENDAIDVPLYAYRYHGNGRIATFTSGISGDWTKNWDDEIKSLFVTNLIDTNTPATYIDVPYTLDVEREGPDAYVNIVPAVLDVDATAKIRITYPNGRRITRNLAFDSSKYSYTFKATDTGCYAVESEYTYKGNTYQTAAYFNIPYFEEYNAFASFDKSNIYEIMKNNGRMTDGEVPNLENDEKEISTHKVSYRIPLLIIAIILLVIDIIVRKLKLSDRRTVSESKRAAKEAKKAIKAAKKQKRMKGENA